MSLLAIIPARGGSKGIPRKNIKSLSGRPLIGWTIDVAKQASCVDRIVVTTDDERIAAVARGLGAEVPFMRPAELATDETPGIAPVLHAIEQLPRHEWILLLQPTSPLRTHADIEAIWQLCQSSAAPSAVSITEVSKHPYWMYAQDYQDCAVYSMPLWSMGAKDLQAEHVASFDEVITLEDHLHDGGFGSWMLESLPAKSNLRASPANAYAHQDIAINALSAPTARYVFYRKRVVIEGEQIRLGGDAYSHKTELDEERADGNLDLNPDVYGPYARTMQFFHKEKLHEELYLAGKISLLTKIRAKFKLVGRQVIVVLTSNKVVVLPDGITVMQEAERGFVDAKVNGLVTGTISAKTFIHLLKAPAAIRKFIFSLISLLFGPIKIYQIIKIILLRRCSYW